MDYLFENFDSLVYGLGQTSQGAAVVLHMQPHKLGSGVFQKVLQILVSGEKNNSVQH